MSALPPMLASTITPQAPALSERFNSASAAFSYCQGSEHSHWMRSGQVLRAFAISSFITCAAFRLTASPPQ